MFLTQRGVAVLFIYSITQIIVYVIDWDTN